MSNDKGHKVLFIGVENVRVNQKTTLFFFSKTFAEKLFWPNIYFCQINFMISLKPSIVLSFSASQLMRNVSMDS